MKAASKVFTAIIFIFLFAPIAILVVFSFNDAKSLSVFSGFSFRWYKELMIDSSTLESVRNTLILAVVATVAGCIIGLVCGILNTIPYSRHDNMLKKVVLKVIRVIVRVYVEVFRGTPMVLQAVFIYFGLPYFTDARMQFKGNTFISRTKNFSVG